MLWNSAAILHTPALTRFAEGPLHFFLDGEAPNWIATDRRGARIVALLDGRRSLGEILGDYARQENLEAGAALQQVYSFVNELERRQLVSPAPYHRAPYLGRSHYLKTEKLSEMWLHTNQLCNLTCTHCLVASGPDGDTGLPLDLLKKVVDDGVALGVERFYCTGGEPYARPDFFALSEHITRHHGRELIVLTNATLFSGERLEKLMHADREKLKLQVSLDGATAEQNDPIRGRGTFVKVLEGVRTLSKLGFEVSLTAAVTTGNIEGLEKLANLAAEYGAKSVHLMWLHRRGRILDDKTEAFPAAEELLALHDRMRIAAAQAGVRYDNHEAYLARVDGRPGVKLDLGLAGWESLCVYSDGQVYPSAAFAGHGPLACGDIRVQSLADIWRGAPVLQRLRGASVQAKAGAHSDPWKFLTGGGDVEHSFFYAESIFGRGDFLGSDPYYPLQLGALKRAVVELAESGRRAFNAKSGFAGPVIYHAMGQTGTVCGSSAVHDAASFEVGLMHSNCVLAFDVDNSRAIVRDYYGAAAEQPQPGLCCPIKYDAEAVRHIPAEVMDRFYGCGSPITQAKPQPGETVVDLGSGGGIDIFIAAKYVGPQGKAIGVDMTDPMLEVANRNKAQVAANLGYDVAEFRKGYLEAPPVEDRSVDLITSNCVINLSPDKRKVFAGMWTMLKDHGRIVISDIVSEVEVPPYLRINHELWGECISGALTEQQFLAELERAGFYGLEVLGKTYWKTVEGYKFFSLTVRGWKFEKTAGCKFIGQQAIYRGPFKFTVDEEGHLFPRNELVEICTDTFVKLARAPYAGHFSLIRGDGRALSTGALPIAAENADAACCAPGDPCCAPDEASSGEQAVGGCDPATGCC